MLTIRLSFPSLELNAFIFLEKEDLRIQLELKEKELYDFQEKVAVLCYIYTFKCHALTLM